MAERHPDYTDLQNVPLVLTTAEASRLTGYSGHLLRELANTGQCPARKAGKDWRFSRDALLAWVAGLEPREAARVHLEVSKPAGRQKGKPDERKAG